MLKSDRQGHLEDAARACEATGKQDLADFEVGFDGVGGVVSSESLYKHRIRCIRIPQLQISSSPSLGIPLSVTIAS
jgi:hypothetical protein